jgi:hypothetical protein
MRDIAVINASTATDGIPDAEIQRMLPAFETQWNRDLKSIWPVGEATFRLVPRGAAPPVGAWWLVFLDAADRPGAFAYRDLTNEGLPLAKVFVKTLRDDGASVSVGATHEICEMAIDPWLNGAYQDRHGTFWAAEICDPVDADRYGYNIDGVQVTDFVTPNWFARTRFTTCIDFKGHAGAPFDVLSGGYAQKFAPGQGWVQVNGAQALDRKRGAPAPGSRREQRTRSAALRRSAVAFR